MELLKPCKRAYAKPTVKTVAVPSSPVLLACTGLEVDCDALLGLGYPCCQASESDCASC